MNFFVTRFNCQVRGFRSCPFRDKTNNDNGKYDYGA